jgi:hypothetical protein
MEPFVGGKLFEQIPAQRFRAAITVRLYFLAGVGLVLNVGDFI